MSYCPDPCVTWVWTMKEVRVATEQQQIPIPEEFKDGVAGDLMSMLRLNRQVYIV